MRKTIKKIIPKQILSLYSNFKRNIEHRKRQGNDVLCLICNSEYKKFGDYGLVTRSNAECYSCGSLERHRLLWKYLKSELYFFENRTDKKMLHFGPEKIFYNIFDTQDFINYVPCDLFPEKYNYKGKSKVIKVDITKIPFEDNHFDVIICNHVLEHIKDDALAMSELFRVLKKGGLGIFQVPIDNSRESTYEDDSIVLPAERAKEFGQHDHVRVYGRDYKERLENAGFDVFLDDFVKKFSAQEIFKFGFMNAETIYKCTKP